MCFKYTNITTYPFLLSALPFLIFCDDRCWLVTIILDGLNCRAWHPQIYHVTNIGSHFVALQRPSSPWLITRLKIIYYMTHVHCHIRHAHTECLITRLITSFEQTILTFETPKCLRLIVHYQRSLILRWGKTREHRLVSLAHELELSQQQTCGLENLWAHLCNCFYSINNIICRYNK